MSNRFHSKFHRQNHHTYTSGTNPDAGHDPIASREQPFRGDFVLSGALSCSAPTSAVAGYFFTNNTSLCAIAGFRGIYVRTPVIAGEFLSTAGDSVSAYGALNGGDFYAGIRGVRARGNTVGVDAYSPNIALNASGVNIGTYTYSPKVALSTNSPLTGASISGDSISLLTVGNGVNILKNRTGIQKTPNASYPAYPLTNIVLDVNGDLLVEGNTLITGSLSALGDLTQIDTVIQITSSLRVNNTGSSTAATIVQTGNQPILACYDNEVSVSVPSFIVDGGTNGWVALGTATPTAPFTIQKSRANNQGNNQPQVRITDNGTTNKVSISTPITNFDRSYIGTETNTSFDIVTDSTSRITVLNNGNVGIGDITPSAKLTVDGSILGDNTLTIYGAISGASTLTIDGNITGESRVTSWGALSSCSTLTVDSSITGKSTLTTDGDITGKQRITSYGALSSTSTLTVDSTITGKSTLTTDGAITGKSTITSYGVLSSASSLTVDSSITGKSTLTTDGAITGKSNITAWGSLSATNNPVYANMLNANNTGFTVAEALNFDLRSALNTNSADMFTIPAGYKFVPTNFSILITSVAGSYTSGNVSVTLVDNSNTSIGPAVSLGSTTVDSAIVNNMTTGRAVAAGNVVRARITAQSLAGYSDLRGTVLVSGYLV